MYSLDYHTIRNWIYVNRVWGKERAIEHVPEYAKRVAREYDADGAARRVFANVEDNTRGNQIIKKNLPLSQSITTHAFAPSTTLASTPSSSSRRSRPALLPAYPSRRPVAPLYRCGSSSSVDERVSPSTADSHISVPAATPSALSVAACAYILE